jgi:hypothetical protein
MLNAIISNKNKVIIKTLCATTLRCLIEDGLLAIKSEANILNYY